MLILLTGGCGYAARGGSQTAGERRSGRCADHAGEDQSLSGDALRPGPQPGDGADVRRQAADLLQLSSAGQAGGAGYAGRLAVRPAGGRILPQHREHPSLRRQRTAGASGPAGSAAGGAAGLRARRPAGADPGGVSAAAAGGPGTGEGTGLSAGKGVCPAGDPGGRTAPGDGGAGEGRAAAAAGKRRAAVCPHSCQPAGRAAGLRPAAGPADGAGVRDPERKDDGADSGDGGDPVPEP